MKSFVSFKDKNHSKSGVTSPLANEDELFSGSVIYNIKRLLCIPDTDPAVHQNFRRIRNTRLLRATTHDAIYNLPDQSSVEMKVGLCRGKKMLKGAVQGTPLEGAIASGIENLHLSRIGATLMSPHYPLIHVCIIVDVSNAVKVFTNVTLKGFPMEVRMPNFDGGHGLWAENLSHSYG
ncbi:unnamed protein product [Fraxinus pennsylvanica]|uniref:Uncharacterized protein n=1 Tax=Fraxinus pennsylvanica TaxID=56036 RepID=A0AAD2E158_9LAMI|nr:unnamed protein product [Fraxinus pennsylvanica]